MGALATFCLERKASPRGVRNNSTLLADFQRALVDQGVRLEWTKPA